MILLVEDNPADALLVREALEEHGTVGEVIVLNDGETAIDYVKAIDSAEGCPDLIIVDLNLPRRTGKEVLGMIRSNSNCSVIPVAVLSSSDARQDREDASRLGATRYIRKPGVLEEFIALGRILKAMATSNDPSA